MDSAIVLTVFAPIASRTSTIRCATIIGPRGVSGKHVHFDVATTATQANEYFVAAIRKADQFVLVFEDRHLAP